MHKRQIWLPSCRPGNTSCQIKANTITDTLHCELRPILLSTMNNDRLEEIETRLTFQEKTLSDLNDVIVKQQSEIQVLQNSYKHLLQRMTSMAENAAFQDNDEVPPHY